MAHYQGPGTPLITAVTMDCRGVDRLLEFWSALLGVENRGRHEQFGFLGPAPGRSIAIWLQEVPEEKTMKNRVHMDFAVPDLAAAEERIVALGGTLGATQEWRGYRWRTCRDPEGNEFDVMHDPSSET